MIPGAEPSAWRGHGLGARETRLNAGGCGARVMLQELPGTFSVVARSDSERPGGRGAGLGEARRCSGESQGQEWGRRQKGRGPRG